MTADGQGRNPSVEAMLSRVLSRASMTMGARLNAAATEVMEVHRSMKWGADGLALPG